MSLKKKKKKKKKKGNIHRINKKLTNNRSTIGYNIKNNRIQFTHTGIIRYVAHSMIKLKIYNVGLYIYIAYI
jgi:hypothetical protein